MLTCMSTTTNGRELWPIAGDWLRNQREKQGLSQRELGRILGASYQSVSNYERGISAPSDTTCESIARLFGVPAAEVRERWGKYNPPGTDMSQAPAPVSIEQAILADRTLLPEAKQHLINQLGLLRRIQRTDRDVLQDELAKVEEDEDERDQ